MSEHDPSYGPRLVPVIDPQVLASLDVHRQVIALGEQIFAGQERQISAALASIAQAPAFAVLDAYRQTFASLLGPMQQLAAFNASVLAPLEQFAALNATYLNHITESLNALGRFSIPDLRIAPFSETFLAYLRDLRPLQWRTARELALRGWWLVPSWSSDFLLDLMAERERRQCSIGPLLVARYRKQRCRELGRLVRAWTLPEFSAGRRKGLFGDALTHYRRGEFRAVILSIALQVEGILKDFLLAERLASPTEIERMSTLTLFRMYVGSEREPSIRGFAMQLELLYSHFQWVAPAPGRRVRRNPQAHGREVPRKSEQEALRMWLMLETLHFHLARVRHARGVGAA